jgi:hypothetical protein
MDERLQFVARRLNGEPMAERRPPSLLISQIVPTAAYTATGQPRFLHPGRTCFALALCQENESNP